MTKTEVKKLFVVINKCYSNFATDDDKAAVWHSVLRELSFEQAQRNLLSHIQQSKFPPTPADIMRVDLQSLPDHEQNRIQTTELLALKESWMEGAAPPPKEIVERWGRK